MATGRSSRGAVAARLVGGSDAGREQLARGVGSLPTRTSTF